jgi:pimeloyl-ACP methyl ester carboxylesterase
MTETAWAELGSITAPTLIVRGAESNILSVETATKMRHTVKSSQLVEVPNAGHLVPGDNPVGFEQVVRAFLGCERTI